MRGGARDRCGAGQAREARVAVKALCAGGTADQDRRRQRAATAFGEQLRAVRLDELKQLALQRVGLACQHAQLRDLLADDAHASARGQAPQAPVDAIELLRSFQRAASQRVFKLAAELPQMPAQAVLDAGAFGDEILAVIR